jgi:pimeloyl-ACP methyl ester carboxylesterase
MPFATRTGVRLHYTETGAGSPPLLFVHGWCCNSTHWFEQVRTFRRTNRIVNADLRGHGKSDAPEQDYTIDGFAEDLEWLMGELSLRKPVVIGHSMGGLIALTLARRKKRQLRAIVIVDGSLHLAMSDAEVEGLMAGLDSPSYLHVARVIVDGFFRPTSPKALRSKETKSLLAVPRHVMVPAIKSLAANMRPAPLDIGIPALFIDAGRSFDELKTIEATVPGIEIGRTIGAGHFNMMEAPDQVNAMIRVFLSQLGTRKR